MGVIQSLMAATLHIEAYKSVRWKALALAYLRTIPGHIAAGEAEEKPSPHYGVNICIRIISVGTQEFPLACPQMP